MSIKEKLQKKKEIPIQDVNIGNEISSKVLVSNSLFAISTIILAIAIGNISKDFWLPSAIYGLLIPVILQLLTVSMGLVLVTQSTTDELASFYNYESTEKERTKLIKELMNMPAKVSSIVFTTCLACDAVWILIIAKIAKLNLNSVIFMGSMVYVGCYYTAIHAMTGISQKICSKHAADIVQKGVSKEEVRKHHTFGMKSTMITVVHIFAPILINAIWFYVLSWRTCISYTSTKLVYFRLIMIGLISLVTYHVFSTILFKRMMRSINNMKDILSGMNRENLHKVKSESTDLSNEFMYNIYLINTIIDILQKILKEGQRVSLDVIESSNELSVISRETAVTSLEQNSGIKELLSAMEETDALSKNIAEKIGEVSLVAKRTTDNIGDGFDILRQNMQKLDEIKRANDVTVEGIKNLTEKVSGINDIARIINSIADQTNIIAFNAELEASSAGEVGENFSMVANEIRRLTNSTIKSTQEIRNRIIEIQHSSDELLLASQNGSKKIIDGNKIINDLNLRFEELKHSSETMDYASEDIKKIIEQQTASFAQIVITLRQISDAAESFSGSTQKISDSAQNLCLISDSLKKLQPKDSEEGVAENASEVK